MSKDLEGEGNPLDSIVNLSANVKKSFLAADLASSFGSVQQRVNASISKIGIPDYSAITGTATSIQNLVPQFPKPSALDFLPSRFPYYAQTPLTEVAMRQQKIADIMGPATIAFAKSLTQYKDYASPITETFKGISAWANSYQVAAKNLAPIFGVVDSIKHMTESLAPQKAFLTNSTLALLANIKATNANLYTFPWRNVYPDEYLRVSGNTKAMEELTEGIYQLLQSKKQSDDDDELTIADGINLAINLDIQNSTDTDLDITEFLSSLTNLFKNFYSLSEEKAKNAINDIKQKYGTIALYLIVIIISHLCAKLFEKGFETVVDAVIGSVENSTNKIITTKDKLLKLKPDGRSTTIEVIPANTPIIILHPNVKKWIFIQFVNSDGEVRQGWTENKDLLL